MSPTQSCEPVLDELDELVAGNPDVIARHSDHLASCDDCRDARHEATMLADNVRGAGHDYVPMADLADRVLAKIDASPMAIGSLPGETSPGMAVASVKEAVKETPPPVIETPKPIEKPVEKAKPIEAKKADVVDIASPGRHGASRRPSRKLVAAAGIAALAAAGVGIYAFSQKSSTTNPDNPVVAKDGNIGKVERIERAAKDGGEGVSVMINGNARPLKKGEALPAGATVKTDDRTRISLVMADGTKLVLDHQTAVVFAASEPRQMKIEAGRLVADVAHVEKRPASVTTPGGRIDVIGTRFSVTATDALTTVQVVRGAIVLNNKAGAKQEVRAGEEGLIDGGNVSVSSAPNLGREVEWSELGAQAPQQDTASSGIGQLRAYKPGEKRDRDWNLALANHEVKVRISGPIARTEITETFRNDSANQLEGVYQFPMPADAQIDSLELDIEGGFMQAAFIDKERAAKIWRGVIDKATPRIERKPEQDIIWVQGPWRDPALLDWKRGGRFELRIFPIPAKGARTIKIAYTQVVKPRGLSRQYVYPLPHSKDGSTVADKFSVDVEVRGAQQGRTRASGYQLANDPSRQGAEAMTLSQSAFVPRGDLVIDYKAQDGDAEVRAWTFAGGAAVAPDEKMTSKKNVGNDQLVVDAQKSIAGDARPTAVIALKPKLPRWDQAKPRDYMIVVDTSQSMAGERMTRSADLAGALIGEMDRRDQFSVMACDSECRRLDGGMRTPTNSAAEEAHKWLREQTPAGASDLVGAVRSASSDFQKGTDRERWVIYVGDGFATTGFRKVGDVEKAIAQTTGTEIRVTTVGIGTDADASVLAAAARGGGGSYLAWVPGQTVNAAAMASLESTYGTALRDAKIELPAGLADVAPTILPTVRAGEEVLVAARITGEVKGDVIVKGTVAGQPFEQKYPLALAVSSAPGNGFVPRLWASLAIEQLERGGRGDDRARIVALSQGYGVMSKETSLLVLESEKMFNAFGVDRTQPTNRWTGEDSVDESLASGTIDYDAKDSDESEGQLKDSTASRSADKSASPKKAKSVATGSSRMDSGGDDLGMDGPGGGKGGGAGMPAPEPAQVAPATKPAAPPRDTKAAERAEKAPPRNFRPGMIAMRRSWHRVPSLGVFDNVSANVKKAVDTAETALAAAPDSREKHRTLVQALAYAGEIDRAREIAAKWLERDKLDPQALGYTADLLGRSGQREIALRTLAGLVDIDADRVSLHERMIKAYENAGRMSQACSHRIAISSIQYKDAKIAGAAMRCLRGVGRDRDAELVLRGLPSDKERTEAEKAATTAPITARTGGDLVVNARWTGAADVDVAVIAPDGTRYSWMGNATVTDSTASDHEQLAVTKIRKGNYLVEITRNGNATGAVRGSLDITALGSKKTIPFELLGSRTTIGRVNVALEERQERIWMDGVNCWVQNPRGGQTKTRCPQ